MQNEDSQEAAAHQNMSSFANEADVDISEGLAGQQHEIRVEDGAQNNNMIDHAQRMTAMREENSQEMIDEINEEAQGENNNK